MPRWDEFTTRGMDSEEPQEFDLRVKGSMPEPEPGYGMRQASGKNVPSFPRDSVRSSSGNRSRSKNYTSAWTTALNAIVPKGNR